MTDHSPDDARLDATEAQMRHALGLQGDVSPQSLNSGSHPQRRRFVRDGEVPVTVVNRDRPDGEPATNQLEVARQAIRSQAAARERAERLLDEAQAAVRDLQTKLAHERLAKDDAVRRAESERRTERAACQQAEQERDKAIAGRQEAEERVREIMAVQEAHRARKLAPKIAPGRKAGGAGAAPRSQPAGDWAANAAATAKPRRRGRPRKVGQSESDIVEWWKPGWKARLR